MERRNRRAFVLINLLIDFGLIFACYFLAWEFRFKILSGIISVDMKSPGTLACMAVYSAVIAISYYFLGIYDYQRSTGARGRCLRILGSNFVGLVILLSLLFLLHLDLYSRLTELFFAVFATALCSIKSILLSRKIRSDRENGIGQKKAVIYGTGKLAREYLRYISAHPETGVSVLGYVGEKEGIEGYTYLGKYKDVSSVLNEKQADDLIVALDADDTDLLSYAVDAANKEGTGLLLIPFYNDYFPSHPILERQGDTNLINLRSTPLDSMLASLVKRLFDIIGSLILIIVTSPIMLAVAVGVRISSPGPIIFRQRRVGKNKKIFEMLKFRSMKVNKEESTGWSKDKDPRKTKFGSFIRKYSLDELPQFFNVFKGEMSLVGPRPEIPYHVEHFKEEIPRYLIRQQVRPGITGWAQVNGLRGNTSIEERVKYDIWYIENWSIWLDIKILFMTVFGGFMNNEK